MPIIKKDDVRPERPVIIVIYGTPGCGKTSVATTAKNPLLIDTDRGSDRSVQIVDTLAANNWYDIENAKNDMAGYGTIIVDTAKAMLDDYLSSYAVDKNYKLKNNTLKRFGQMADDFKDFVDFLRQGEKDIIFICHDKEVTDGDVVKHTPDCTGQSKDLLLRIADQVGYVSMVNKQRTITFEPTDNYVGKNVAQIGAEVIPDATSPDFNGFMAGIIAKVKKSIQSKSEAQRKANEQITKLRKELSDIEDEEGAAKLLVDCKELPQIMKQPFFNEITVALAAKGFVWDGKKFTKPSAEKKPAEEKKEAKKESEKKPADGKEKAAS